MGTNGIPLVTTTRGLSGSLATGMMGTVTASAGCGVVVLGVVVVVVDVVVVWNRLRGGGAEVLEQLWDGKWIRNAVL